MVRIAKNFVDQEFHAFAVLGNAIITGQPLPAIISEVGHVFSALGATLADVANSAFGTTSGQQQIIRPYKDKVRCLHWYFQNLVNLSIISMAARCIMYKRNTVITFCFLKLIVNLQTAQTLATKYAYIT